MIMSSLARVHRTPSAARRATSALTLLMIVFILVIATDGEGGSNPWACISAKSVPDLARWSARIGHPITCVVSYVDAAPDWQSWTEPWVVLYQHVPQYDWVDWYDRGHRGRHLILTLSMIPTRLRETHWLRAGAMGSYTPFARALARNLVAAGMGNVVIRLGHEANGTWYADSLPESAKGRAEWVRFWDRTVAAMRAVPGARFRFDWNVNAGVRAIPLASFYPGDRYVDVVGVDAYDTLPARRPGDRVSNIVNQPDGLAAVDAFARGHHKPMSIPEWGIGPRGVNGAAGDDPAYVVAVSRAVRSGNVLFQSYFTGGTEGQQIVGSPRSLALLRRLFAG